MNKYMQSGDPYHSHTGMVLEYNTSCSPTTVSTTGTAGLTGSHNRLVERSMALSLVSG